MKVYELQHISDGSVRTLGFFSSLSKRDEAVEALREKEGFCDFPMGFATFDRSVNDTKVVFLVQVFISSETEDFEYARSIGVYAREAEAEKAAQNFIDRNRDYLGGDELSIELAIDTYKLDSLNL